MKPSTVVGNARAGCGLGGRSERGEAWAQSFDARTEDGWGGIAALLRAGIAASEDAERLRRWKREHDDCIDDMQRAINAAQQGADKAWLAAWDAEWSRHFETVELAEGFHDKCVLNAKLSVLLEKATACMTERRTIDRLYEKGGHWAECTQRDATNTRAMDALLAEIEGALK
jgi:hypothetical protein